MALYILSIFLLQIFFSILVYLNIKDNKDLTDSKRKDFLFFSFLPVFWFFVCIFNILEYGTFTFARKWVKASQDTVLKFWDVVYTDDWRDTDIQCIVLWISYQDTYTLAYKDVDKSEGYGFLYKKIDDIRIFKDKLNLDNEAKLLREAQLLHNQAKELEKKKERILSETKVPNLIKV